MKIAQVSPLFESVPPRLYGGTERIVAYLTEELVHQGHDVTLFASGDSETRAHLVAGCPRALRLGGRPGADAAVAHVALIELAFKAAHEFDVMHIHLDSVHFPLAARSQIPVLTTLHGRMDLEEYQRCYRLFRHLAFTSISRAQEQPMPWLGWRGTVHHGLPRGLYGFSERHAGYLAFLGRISPEKRVDRAIEIATRAGVPLKIAAKVDAADRDYFDHRVRPLLCREGVEFIGEIGEAEKADFLGGAAALLFPVDWPEPFGLVMIEAMACGTPVIAWPVGSVPEVVSHGHTGFLVRSIDEGVRAVGQLDALSRTACRAEFERRFTAARMARDYVDIYLSEIEARSAHDGASRAAHTAGPREDGAFLGPSRL